MGFRSEAIFTGNRGQLRTKDHGSNSLIDIVDTNNPDFGGFGDPVINTSGTVANDVFRNDGNAEILSGNRQGVTARTDVTGATFFQFDHPSINDSDAVAFPALTTDGHSGVFLELTGGASPVPVIPNGRRTFWLDGEGRGSWALCAQ